MLSTPTTSFEQKLSPRSDTSDQPFLQRTTTIDRDDKSENIYHSCCGGHSDKRLVVLLTQVGISAIVLIFSGVMMATDREGDNRAIYMSLMSSTLSFWLGKNTQKE